MGKSPQSATPSPLLPVPVLPSAIFTVTAQFIMSGSISEFDNAKREEIASHVASELGVQLSQVTVQVEAASVKISVKVEYDSQPGAVAGSKSLPVALTTSTIGVDP